MNTYTLGLITYIKHVYDHRECKINSESRKNIGITIHDLDPDMYLMINNIMKQKYVVFNYQMYHFHTFRVQNCVHFEF